MHEGISRAAALTQTYHTFRISLYNNHACGSAIHKHHSFLASNKITIIHVIRFVTYQLSENILPAAG